MTRMAESTKTFVWSKNRGPNYRCTDQDGNEVMQVHEDLGTHRWRVSYPNGTSSIHSGPGEARREAERVMSTLGDERSLSFIVH